MPHNTYAMWSLEFLFAQRNGCGGDSLHYAVHYLFAISEWISPLGKPRAVIFAVLLVVVIIVFALRVPFKSITRFSAKARH